MAATDPMVLCLIQVVSSSYLTHRLYLTVCGELANRFAHGPGQAAGLIIPSTFFLSLARGAS